MKRTRCFTNTYCNSTIPFHKRKRSVDILTMCSGDAMLRQVIEAVNELSPTLNSKEEWGNTNKLRERRNGFELIAFTNLNCTNSARMQR